VGGGVVNSIEIIWHALGWWQAFAAEFTMSKLDLAGKTEEMEGGGGVGAPG